MCPSARSIGNITNEIGKRKWTVPTRGRPPRREPDAATGGARRADLRGNGYFMDIVAIINELRTELDRIDGLIAALEGLQSGRRRGRPPKALQALRSGAAPVGSPAVRRAVKAVKKSKRTSSAESAAKKRAERGKEEPTGGSSAAGAGG